MDDQTTTTEEVVDSGVQETQPEQTTQPEAVQDDVQDQQSSTEPSHDEDTLKWMEAKGIDPSSPDALTKLAKSAREAEKAMHQKAGEASQLKKSMESVSDDYAEQVAEATGQDPELLKRVQRMEVRDAIQTFYAQNPGAADREADIAQVITERPYLANDLEAAYALVQAKNAQSLKSEGAKEALQSLAGKQRAAAPSGSAVNPSTAPQRITRALIAEKTQAGDIAWLNKHQGDINTLVANGELN